MILKVPSNSNYQFYDSMNLRRHLRLSSVQQSKQGSPINNITLKIFTEIDPSVFYQGTNPTFSCINKPLNFSIESGGIMVICHHKSSLLGGPQNPTAVACPRSRSQAHTGLGKTKEQGHMFSTMLQTQLHDRVTSSRKSPLTDISW